MNDPLVAPKKTIVLLSGGLDSTVALAKMLGEGRKCVALTFDYGQRHRNEIEAANQIADTYDVPLIEETIDLTSFVHAPLTNSHLDMPTYESVLELPSGLSPVYVPARNVIFLSFALAHAENMRAQAVCIGATREDQEGFPDCTPQFFNLFEQMAHEALPRDPDVPWLRIETPMIYLTKGEVILKGIELGAPLNLTVSCYDPDLMMDETPCGKCGACITRAAGFAEAGVPDPAVTY